MKRRFQSSVRLLLSSMVCSIAIVTFGNIGIVHLSSGGGYSIIPEDSPFASFLNASSTDLGSRRRRRNDDDEEEEEEDRVGFIIGNQTISAAFDPAPQVKTLCASWDVNMDNWWVHHYQWKIVSETPKGYCFQRWTGGQRLSSLSKLYRNQFLGDCNKTISKQMWSTGWGADFRNVVDGLRYGMEHNVPMAMRYKRRWHYAKHVDECKTDISTPGTLDCYFLPHSICPPMKVPVNRSMLDDNRQFMKDNPLFHKYLWQSNNRFLYEWLTRPKTWLRKKVMEYVQPYLAQLSLRDSSCTVIHVRRGDVVLHTNQFRRYFPLQDYMEAARQYNVSKTILLLTDDANAILEARALYPNHTWVTMDRQRYQGPQGGWEGHFPSGHPLTETIVLLGTFQLVQQCSLLVHTHSNLAELYWGYMLTQNGRGNVTKIQIDAKMEKYNDKNANTVNVSRADWR